MFFFCLFLAAQALLGDWLNSRLRVDLELDDEDDPMFSDERAQPSPPGSRQPTAPTYSNFDGTKIFS